MASLNKMFDRPSYYIYNIKNIHHNMNILKTNANNSTISKS